MAISVKQHDVGLENKILSLMFKSENIIDSVIESNIQSEDFTFPLNQEIFDELIDIYRDSELGNICVGDDIDLLQERLATGDRNQDKELLITINKIKNAKADSKHVQLYIKQLKDLSKIRGIVQATRNVTAYLKDNDNVDADELVNLYDESYQNVFNNVISTTKSEATSDVVKRTIKDMIEDSMKETINKFNLEELDMYAKILDGYLTYVVGDTGLGKTTVATHLASECAKRGSRVLFVNLETKNEDCVKKLISRNVEVDGRRIKYMHLINPVLMTDKDWDIVENIAEDNPFEEYGIYWLFRPGLTTEELKREIVKHVRMYDIDIVIGDYYQLLKKEGYEGSPEGVVIPLISKDLMEMAGQSYLNPEGKMKQIAHVWLSQTNKDLSYRQDKHPTKEDLYFGGQRDARLIVGIYRDEYYDDNTKYPGIMELGILKQNNGIANMWFPYKFDSTYQTIRDMTDEEKEIFEEGYDDED